MTEYEFEILRTCRSAELAYFLSEHTMDKPRFIQQWFKNKIKNDREELSTEQVHIICSEWQLKQKIFYKKYKGFTDHHNKVIQSLQFLAGQSDTLRIESCFKLCEAMSIKVLNGLNADTPVDRESIGSIPQEGLVLIEDSEREQINDQQDIANELTLVLYTLDARRFHQILDIFRLHGFDVSNKGKYVVSSLVEVTLNSSSNNEINKKATSFEHDREQDWRDEILAGAKKV